MDKYQYEFSGIRRRRRILARRMRRGVDIYYPLNDLLSWIALAPIPEESDAELIEDSIKSPPSRDLPSSSTSVHTQTPKFLRKKVSSSSSGRLNPSHQFRSGAHNFLLVAQLLSRSKNKDTTESKESKKKCILQ